MDWLSLNFIHRKLEWKNLLENNHTNKQSLWEKIKKEIKEKQNYTTALSVYALGGIGVLPPTSLIVSIALQFLY